MKSKRRKCMISILMFFIVVLSVYGQNSVAANMNTAFSRYGEEMVRYVTASYDDYLIYRGNYGYMNLVEDIRTNSWALYFLKMADIFAGTESKPNKEKYIEVLMNIIATYDMDNSESIFKQNTMDNLKDSKDYIMDFVEMGKEIISIKAGFVFGEEANELESATIIAIDELSMSIENTNNWIEAISNLETILQNYKKYEAFLKVIEEKSQGELKDAAFTLRNSMEKVMEIKLNTYVDISNENFENFTEFFLVMSFLAL